MGFSALWNTVEICSWWTWNCPYPILRAVGDSAGNLCCFNAGEFLQHPVHWIFLTTRLFFPCSCAIFFLLLNGKMEMTACVILKIHWPYASNYTMTNLQKCRILNTLHCARKNHFSKAVLTAFFFVSGGSASQCFVKCAKLHEEGAAITIQLYNYSYIWGYCWRKGWCGEGPGVSR